MEQKTLKDSALTYEGKSTKNIAELPKVSTALLLENREGINSEGKTFAYQVIVVDGQDYRVPVSILRSLKVVLEDNPNLKEFKVKKTGQGMDTDYTLIPLS
jgi:hypothetical protein